MPGAALLPVAVLVLPAFRGSQAAHRSVSLDLMMRSLFTIGATASEIAKWIKRSENDRAASRELSQI